MSEQIPTVCALGVLVNPDLTVRKAGGYIIQLLPGAAEADISKIEENVKHAKPVTALLDEGKEIGQIVREMLAGFESEVLYTAQPVYRCGCSRARVRSMLASLGEKELSQMAEEMPEVEVKCHFCNRVYRFTPAQIKNFHKTIDKSEKNTYYFCSNFHREDVFYGIRKVKRDFG